MGKYITTQTLLSSLENYIPITAKLTYGEVALHGYMCLYMCMVYLLLLFNHKSCLTLCSLMDCSTPGFPVLHYLPEFPQTHSIESVMPSNHLILCYSFLLMPLLFLCIRVFSNESVLCIRWPKYWSFSFSISPSNEDSGLISFRMD